MTPVTPERPKYSTGFKLYVFGWAILGLGVLLTTKVWGPFGVIAIPGVILLVGFKYPSDWRKTWPDDFPITRRLFGRPPPTPTAQEQIDSAHKLSTTPQSPGDPTESPDWWSTAPASSRRGLAVVLMLAGVVFFIWGIREPTNYHGYTSHLYGWISGAFFFVFGLVQFRGARSSRD
jgi:hypothetical protein